MSKFMTTKLNRSKTYLLIFAGIALLLVLVIYFKNLSDKNVEDFKEVCDALNAEYRDNPEWMCIRNGEVVYDGAN